MTDATRQTDASPWARLGAEVPREFDGGRVLLVGSGADDHGLALKRAAEVISWDPAEKSHRPDGPFALLISAGAIQATAHPANLLTVLCEVAAPGATLLLHSRVLTDPAHSAFANFAASRAGSGETEWLPGRLALRWTVETNGFTVDRWIDAGSSEPRGEDDALLMATRNERTPALILATPTMVDGPSQKGGGA